MNGGRKKGSKSRCWFTIDDIVDITERSEDDLKNDRRRGLYDMKDFRKTFMFMASERLKAGKGFK